MDHQHPPYPSSINEAVAILVADLPLREKVSIARMTEEDLLELNLSLGLYIRDRFGLWSANRELINACLKEFPCETKEVYQDAATSVIIKALWRELRHTHGLRAI